MKKGLVVLLIFLGFIGGVNGKVPDLRTSSAETPLSNIYQQACSAQQGESLFPLIEKNRYQIGETIHIDYEVNTNSEVISHEFEGRGFSMLTVNRNGNEVLVELKALAGYQECYFSLALNLKNGNNLQSTVYGVKTEVGVFISPSSYDNAKDRAYKYLFDNGYITKEEWEEQYQEDIKNSVINLSPNSMSRSSTGTISGTLTWRDDQ